MELMVRKGSCFLLGMVAVMAFVGSAGAGFRKAANESCSVIYGASICTSYQMQAGKITELSLRVPIAMIQRVPADSPMVWPPKPDVAVSFPSIVQEQTGFTFADIYWNPHGHGPAAYAVPHFDFHFYFAPKRKVEAIDCKNTVKPQALPARYALPDENVPGLGELVGLCIPNMGMHSIPAGDLNLKTAWKGSMLVGYYNQKPIFFEPMITSSALLEKHSFSLTVPEGVEPAAHVRYPKSFRAVYLPKSNAYDLTFFY